VQVQVVVVQPLALADKQPERDVEALLARAAYPEEAVALLVHLDEPLLEQPGLQHQLVHLQLQLGGELRGAVGRVIWRGANGGKHGLWLLRK
jgi:hypothetical protein